jgi:hypothetical protein
MGRLSFFLGISANVNIKKKMARGNKAMEDLKY